MSASSVITLGYGTPGSASLVITLGYGTGATPEPTPSPSTEQPAGGWYAAIELHSMQRRKKREEIKEAREAEDEIEQEIDRNIARLLHEQEEKDAERKDLERIKALVKRYKDVVPVEINSERVQQAITEAQRKQSVAALQKLQREFERMIEEEEHAFLMLLASME